jgi:hypothetical protein
MLEQTADMLLEGKLGNVAVSVEVVGADVLGDKVMLSTLVVGLEVEGAVLGVVLSAVVGLTDVGREVLGLSLLGLTDVGDGVVGSALGSVVGLTEVLDIADVGLTDVGDVVLGVVIGIEVVEFKDVGDNVPPPPMVVVTTGLNVGLVVGFLAVVTTGLDVGLVVGFLADLDDKLETVSSEDDDEAPPPLLVVLEQDLMTSQACCHAPRYVVEKGLYPTWLQNAATPVDLHFKICPFLDTKLPATYAVPTTHSLGQPAVGPTATAVVVGIAVEGATVPEHAPISSQACCHAPPYVVEKGSYPTWLQNAATRRLASQDLCIHGRIFHRHQTSRNVLCTRDPDAGA